MKQFEEFNEDELRQMEQQLRSLPEPFSSDAPDDRYFANFRVRLMQRIDAAQPAAKPSVFASIFAWFTPMRSLATGLAVVVVVLGSVWMFSTPQAPQLASKSAPVITKPAPPPMVQAPVAPAAVAEVAKPAAKKPAPTVANIETPKHSSKDDLADLDLVDLSGVDPTLSAGSADEPVDISTLSGGELQAVLDGVSSLDK